jgi:hypothetical protein
VIISNATKIVSHALCPLEPLMKIAIAINIALRLKRV